ncbi:MAG: putative hydrolase of the superfamily [Solirubrobacteraceae bacterium]|nr:putative hydrolase of the superfamily [Solirubrobacteraceae bacterium]
MSAIDVVVSDFGGVLTTPLIHTFAALQEEDGIDSGAMGAALRRIAESDGRHPLYELECGRMTEHDFLAALSAQLREDLGRDVHMHSFAERYFGHLDANDAMIAFLRELRGRGYRLAMLTNNVREWEPRWRAMLPMDELFELVVDSAFVGVRKPDPAIYRLTCDRLGVAPERCLFVDDLEVNCAAAAELGMAAVLFRSSEQAIAEMREALGDSQLSEPSRSQR